MRSTPFLRVLLALVPMPSDVGAQVARPQGADLVDTFVFESIREGGAQTMSPDSSMRHAARRSR